MRNKFKYFSNYKIMFISVLTLTVITIYAAVSSLVYIQNDKLSYSLFAMQGQTNEDNIIPDYSFAGYKGGGIALPTLATSQIKQVVSPKDGDDRINIQTAIDYVESLPLDENNIRGIVLLKRGNYQVSGTLTINASGVVLLGEGQGEDGTVITATQTSKHNLIEIQGSGTNITEDVSSTVSITTQYVPVGTNRFKVSDTSLFSVGDTISVKKTPNDFWITDLDMAQYGWAADDYTIKHERIITDISDNTISTNIPMVDVIENKYGGGVISKASVDGRISNCGIENIRLKSVYLSITDEEHAWSAIVLRRTVNSWIKNVTAVHFAYSCVQITKESNFNTIEDCAMLDPISEISGGRRYSFYISNGLGNLFQRCYSRGGRHDYITGARVTGPNVFLDCYAENTYNDIGPHHRWATGTLFDNIFGGQMRVQNRKDFGTGHGWAGVQTMFWNLKSNKEDIKVESPKGAKNWAIGCEGLNKNGDGYWEDWNNRVTPRSLFLQQLKDRLGLKAVENITTSEQQDEEPIWQHLQDWAGNGNVIISVPGRASFPSPKNGTNQTKNSFTLSWKAGIDVTSHDLYFGTSSPPPFIKTQTDTTFNAGNLESNKIYYWRIDEKNEKGITKGEVWNFSLFINSATDTLKVNEDSYVQGGDNADTNFGTDNKLVVKSNSIEKYVRETFLKFDLSSLDNQISNAKLRLKVSKDVSDVTHKINFVSDDNWAESEITYNTKPNIGITLDTKLVPLLAEWIEFDVTSQVQTEVQNDKIISFAILESSLNHYATYNSRESTNQNYHPNLILVHSNSTSIEVNNLNQPIYFFLEQNFPNPFNPTTIIKYSIPVGTTHELSLPVTLRVFDILGKNIITLVNQKQSAGNYQVTFDANDLTSGIYYYRLKLGGFVKTRKMILIK